MKGRSFTILPLMLGLGFALLYLLTLTQVHTFDALSYVLSVERKPWQAVFHPHHLAYGPLGVFALRFGQLVGYAGGAALPMQIINALTGALGVAYFARLVLNISNRADLALALALLLGSSYAYWYYAIEIEVYTVATLLLILCAGLLWRLAQGHRGATFVLLGITQAATVLFHQTNVLLCGPIALLALCMLWRQQHDQKRMLLGWLSYAGSLLLLVVLPYLWVGFGVSGFTSWTQLWVWLTEYARTGWWGGPITASHWQRLAQGLSESWTPQGGGWVWLALLGCAAVGVWTRRDRRFKALTPNPSPIAMGEGRRSAFISSSFALLLATWLLVYGGFFFWWEPDNIEFWIASLPPVLLLLTILLQKTRRWGMAVFVLMAVALLLITVNYEAIRRRGDASSDLQRRIARALAQQSTPADLLLIPDGLQELYLPYYEQRENFISLNQALFDQGTQWDAACTSIQQRIETALHAGATALIADQVLQPPAVLLSRHGLSQKQVDACFAGYQQAMRPVPLAAGLPHYQRLLYAQEYADGDGWHFESGPLGWQAANLQHQRFEQGWAFVPERDPSLTSPLLRLDTRQIQAIEITIANGTKASDAQLFFLGEDGLTSEQRSIRWQLASGQQTYRLDLQATPGWQGIVTRLRLDPVGVGDGGTIRVVLLRLLRK